MAWPQNRAREVHMSVFHAHIIKPRVRKRGQNRLILYKIRLLRGAKLRGTALTLADPTDPPDGL